MKWDYIFRHRYHRLVTGRNLLVEYAGVVAVLTLAWIVTVTGVVVQLS